MIAEARSEKLKHLEEVYQANRRSAEMEAKYVLLYKVESMILTQSLKNTIMPNRESNLRIKILIL